VAAFLPGGNLLGARDEFSAARKDCWCGLGQKIFDEAIPVGDLADVNDGVSAWAFALSAEARDRGTSNRNTCKQNQS
jgi:hypothetical protein